ncbi:hypothetical protein niasHT_031790 [Heterodera trifolii]|uniref:Uncharacterized protein n=1 Tax=Heterodera trifolii TaxID=157864 RepID=A0ABD2IJP1_9BILA
MSDNPNEAEKEMKKPIIISENGWRAVFNLLPPSQLGLQIALISPRFDAWVDEHFMARKWALGFIVIGCKNGENGAKEMKITNLFGHELPIPQIQVPFKVSGFRCIHIFYIDPNVITFIRRFLPLFAACPINFTIDSKNERILMSFLRNIWPMLGKNIIGIMISKQMLRRLRKLAPSILNNCPSLRFVSIESVGHFFAEFPCDDGAMAWAGQAVAKWLFDARPDNVPKVLICSFNKNERTWELSISEFKANFDNASSPANFIVVVWFQLAFAPSILPFDQTNELTREQLSLKSTDNICRFVLTRSPIGRDESKWIKWVEEAIDWQISKQWQRINFGINNEEDVVGDGLLD